jgi:hypothetical protein
VSSRCSARLRPALHAVCRTAVLLAAAVLVGSARPRANPGEPTGAVTGRIARSDGPKYDVHVIDQVTWMTVITRPDGTFRLELLPVGDHLFRIRSDYCEVQLIAVTVRAGQVSTLEVELACKPRPCPKPDRADPTCIVENPEQRQRVGTFCEVHRGTKLKLDIVPIHYDIVGYTPGLGRDERNVFPNARPWWSAGCVDRGQRWAEVAYCNVCRAIFELRSLASRLRHLPRNR